MTFHYKNAVETRTTILLVFDVLKHKLFSSGLIINLLNENGLCYTAKLLCLLFDVNLKSQ